MSTLKTLALERACVYTVDMPASRTERSTYHHGHLPETLVAASTALIRDGGIEGFSLRAAARQAGVDPAAVYRHFADKSALLGAVAAVGFSALADAMDGAIAEAGTDPTARFRAGARAYVQYAIDNPEFFRVMFSPYGAGGPDAPARGRGRGAGGASAYELLAATLDDLQRAGRIDADLERAVTVAWAGVHGLAHLLTEQVIATDPSPVHHAEIVADVILRGLGGGPNHARHGPRTR